jgi:hypothetical protein
VLQTVELIWQHVSLLFFSSELRQVLVLNTGEVGPQSFGLFLADLRTTLGEWIVELRIILFASN